MRQAALLRRWAAWGARVCPPWFVYLVPPIIGAFFAFVLPRARASVLANMRRIHGVRPLTSEARDVLATFSNFAQSLTTSLAPERILFRRRRYLVRGEKNVTPFFVSKQGVLMLTAHVGPWDSAAMGLRSMQDVSVMMLMSPEADEGTAEFQDALRKQVRVTVVRVGETNLDALPVLAHLEAGGVVVAQMDRVPPGRAFLETELFGEPFLVPRGLFQLASIARVPLVPVFTARLDKERDLIAVGEPISIPRRPSEEELLAGARRVVAMLEGHLEAFSTQWFQFDTLPAASSALPVAEG